MGEGREDRLATTCDAGSRQDRCCPLSLVVSGERDPIEDAIEENYGIEYLPVSHGRGKPCTRSRFA